LRFLAREYDTSSVCFLYYFYLRIQGISGVLMENECRAKLWPLCILQIFGLIVLFLPENWPHSV